MRKVLIGALEQARRGQNLWWKLTGQTPEGISEQRIVSGKAWEEFCDTLKAAGAALRFPGAPLDPFDQAEGYRYLSRLARAGLEGFVEDADPRAPVLRRTAHETIKLGADNPDNHYFSACICGAYEYRIRGNRGTVAPAAIENLAGVKEVIPVSHAYKLVSREFHPEDTVIHIGGVDVGGNGIVVIGGPCAVESLD